MRYDVGIGEFKISSRPGDLIKTYALGSCVAVILYDKVRRIGGMIHLALPESAVNPEKAKRMPGYFVDTGLPVFFDTISKLGAEKRNLVLKIAGGSNIMDSKGAFNIGRRNVIAVKRYLWKVGFGVLKEDVGGNISRTVSLEIDDGNVLLSHAGKEWSL